MTIKHQLPTIRSARQTAKSKLFTIEQLDLLFSNGEVREYERIAGGSRGAVMVVPMKNQHTMLLVREYCAGTHTYELGFPKGIIDPGEKPEQAANRELKEEIGFGAQSLIHIQQVMMAPAFLNAKMEIYLAEALYPDTLVGDEPEPLEVVEWPLADYLNLLSQADFNEARSIAALMLVVDKLRGS